MDSDGVNRGALPLAVSLFAYWFSYYLLFMPIYFVAWGLWAGPNSIWALFVVMYLRMVFRYQYKASRGHMLFAWLTLFLDPTPRRFFWNDQANRFMMEDICHMSFLAAVPVLILSLLRHAAPIYKEVHFWLTQGVHLDLDIDYPYPDYLVRCFLPGSLTSSATVTKEVDHPGSAELSASQRDTSLSLEQEQANDAMWKALLKAGKKRPVPRPHLRANTDAEFFDFKIEAGADFEGGSKEYRKVRMYCSRGTQTEVVKFQTCDGVVTGRDQGTQTAELDLPKAPEVEEDERVTIDPIDDEEATEEPEVPMGTDGEGYILEPAEENVEAATTPVSTSPSISSREYESYEVPEASYETQEPYFDLDEDAAAVSDHRSEFQDEFPQAIEEATIFTTEQHMIGEAPYPPVERSDEQMESEPRESVPSDDSHQDAQAVEETNDTIDLVPFIPDSDDSFGSMPKQSIAPVIKSPREGSVEPAPERPNEPYMGPGFDSSVEHTIPLPIEQLDERSPAYHGQSPEPQEGESMALSDPSDLERTATEIEVENQFSGLDEPYSPQAPVENMMLDQPSTFISQSPRENLAEPMEPNFEDDMDVDDMIASRENAEDVDMDESHSSNLDGDIELEPAPPQSEHHSEPSDFRELEKDTEMTAAEMTVSSDVAGGSIRPDESSTRLENMDYTLLLTNDLPDQTESNYGPAQWDDMTVDESNLSDNSPAIVEKPSPYTGSNVGQATESKPYNHDPEPMSESSEASKDGHMPWVPFNFHFGAPSIPFSQETAVEQASGSMDTFGQPDVTPDQQIFQEMQSSATATDEAQANVEAGDEDLRRRLIAAIEASEVIDEDSEEISSSPRSEWLRDRSLTEDEAQTFEELERVFAVGGQEPLSPLSSGRFDDSGDEAPRFAPIPPEVQNMIDGASVIKTSVSEQDLASEPSVESGDEIPLFASIPSEVQDMIDEASGIETSVSEQDLASEPSDETSDETPLFAPIPRNIQAVIDQASATEGSASEQGPQNEPTLPTEYTKYAELRKKYEDEERALRKSPGGYKDGDEEEEKVWTEEQKKQIKERPIVRLRRSQKLGLATPSFIPPVPREPPAPSVQHQQREQQQLEPVLNKGKAPEVAKPAPVLVNGLWLPGGRDYTKPAEPIELDKPATPAPQPEDTPKKQPKPMKKTPPSIFHAPRSQAQGSSQRRVDGAERMRELRDPSRLEALNRGLMPSENLSTPPRAQTLSVSQQKGILQRMLESGDDIEADQEATPKPTRAP